MKVYGNKELQDKGAKVDGHYRIFCYFIAAVYTILLAIEFSRSAPLKYDIHFESIHLPVPSHNNLHAWLQFGAEK